MSIKETSTGLGTEQAVLLDLYAARQQLINGAVNIATRVQILSKTFPENGPFKVEHITPECLPGMQEGLLSISRNIVNLNKAIHYQSLNRPTLTQQGARAFNSHVAQCQRSTKLRINRFFEKFLAGTCDTSDLPEPIRPHYQPVDGDTCNVAPTSREMLQQRLNEAYNARAHKSLQQSASRFQNAFNTHNSMVGLLHNVGDLHFQMQFLHFIQEKFAGQRTIKDITLEEFEPLKAEFLSLDAAFAPEPILHEKVKKKKNRKRKKAKAPQRPAPAQPSQAITPSAVRVDPALKERVDTTVRLNKLQASAECAPAQRVLRWSLNADNLDAIRNFVDYDIQGKPYKPYEKLSSDDLRMHKENHDIPMHTIHREKKLLSQYSNLNVHESPKNGTQYGRQFYVEKINRNAQGEVQSEKGIILTSVGADRVLFHCQFIRTSKIEESHLEPRTRTEELAAREEKEDGGEAPAPFQFEGRYHLEIDEATRDIVIKIGQDNDPSQVIYRIKPLTR